MDAAITLAQAGASPCMDCEAGSPGCEANSPTRVALSPLPTNQMAIRAGPRLSIAEPLELFGPVHKGPPRCEKHGTNARQPIIIIVGL